MYHARKTQHDKDSQPRSGDRYYWHCVMNFLRMDEDDPFWSVQLMNNAENNRPYAIEARLEYQVGACIK